VSVAQHGPAKELTQTAVPTMKLATIVRGGAGETLETAGPVPAPARHQAESERDELTTRVAMPDLVRLLAALAPTRQR
jgi:hypothetical protein